MIQCNINLYIFIFNKDKLVYEVISKNLDTFSVPSKTIECEQNIQTTLEHIFKQHIDLDPLYTNFVLADVNNSCVLNVDYFCLVPYSTKIKQGQAISIKNEKIYSATIRQIMAKL
jgi:hypothetical protein